MLIFLISMCAIAIEIYECVALPVVGFKTTQIGASFKESVGDDAVAVVTITAPSCRLGYALG